MFSNVFEYRFLTELRRLGLSPDEDDLVVARLFEVGESLGADVQDPRRAQERFSTFRRCDLVHGALRSAGIVRDISLGGMRIVSPAPLAVGACLEIRVHDLLGPRFVFPSQVQWAASFDAASTGHVRGVAFAGPPRLFDAYADSERWLPETPTAEREPAPVARQRVPFWRAWLAT